MKYHVELYCEQTLATEVDGSPGMTEAQAREAALEKADRGEAEFVCDLGETTFWPIGEPMNLRAARRLLD